MRLTLFILAVLSIFSASTVSADRIVVSPADLPPYDLYHPKTRSEIYSSYSALVEKRDGITNLEARLIAQYEAVQEDLDLGYEVSKPKIIGESAQEWRVRIPSKFSISQNKRPPDFIVCVDKKNGKIACFAPAEGSD